MPPFRQQEVRLELKTSRCVVQLTHREARSIVTCSVARTQQDYFSAAIKFRTGYESLSTFAGIVAGKSREGALYAATG
jgi:hypothetical protein